MDLVNSVTQNSNNRNVTMENQGGCGGGGGGDRGEGDGASRGHAPASQQMSAASEHADEGPQAQGRPAIGAAAPEPVRAPAPASSQVPDYLKAIGMDPRKFWPKKYRFTREKSPGQHNPLTIAQRNFYETNGYIIFDECASKRLLDAIRTQTRDSGPGMVSEFLLEKLLMRNSKLIPYVKCFCDENLMLMTHRLVDNFTEPQTTTTTTTTAAARSEQQQQQQHHHQQQQQPLQTHETNNTKDLIDQNQQQRQLLFRDWVYLPFRPIDKVCCAVTAIEPLEHVLLLVPGTHRVGQVTISSTLDDVSAAYDSSQERDSAQGLRREIFECSPEKLSTLVDKSKKGFKYINLKPGQTLFYHPGLIHGFSNDLVNFRKRQLVSIAYYAAADCEYVDLRRTSPELMADPGPAAPGQRQQVPISLAHFGHKDPRDYTSWLDKPKLLADPRANL